MKLFFAFKGSAFLFTLIATFAKSNDQKLSSVSSLNFRNYEFELKPIHMCSVGNVLLIDYLLSLDTEFVEKL